MVVDSNTITIRFPKMMNELGLVLFSHIQYPLSYLWNEVTKIRNSQQIKIRNRVSATLTDQLQNELFNKKQQGGEKDAFPNAVKHIDVFGNILTSWSAHHSTDKGP